VRPEGQPQSVLHHAYAIGAGENDCSALGIPIVRGAYSFSGLPAGTYTLKLSALGFRQLTMTSVRVADGEQRQVPPLELVVGMCPARGDNPWPDSYSLLPVSAPGGSLAGKIEVEPDTVVSKTAPVAGADVRLMCDGVVCGNARTGAKGDFVFSGLEPGLYSVRVSRAGFYPSTGSGYRVQNGLQTNWSIYFERCPRLNCDAALRPPKPIAICE
jgi:hypothetical protein